MHRFAIRGLLALALSVNATAQEPEPRPSEVDNASVSAVAADSVAPATTAPALTPDDPAQSASAPAPSPTPKKRSAWVDDVPPEWLATLLKTGDPKLNGWKLPEKTEAGSDPGAAAYKMGVSREAAEEKAAE